MAKTCTNIRSQLNWTAAAGLALGLLLAGCGSSPDPGTASTESAAPGSAGSDATVTDDTSATTAGSGNSSAGGDGCDLISDDVAAQILGIEIVRRESNVDATTGGIGCIKGTERVDDLTTAFYVSISVTPGGAAFVDQASAEAGSQSVPAVGDSAVYLPSAGALFAADGADLLQAQVVKAGVPGTLDEAITVAQDVLANR